MKEGIQFITLWRGEINRFRDKIMEFLLGLGEEKETLGSHELSDDEYLEVCNRFVNNAMCIILALSRYRIVGLTGLRLPEIRLHIIGDAWPFVSSYTVVNRDFQGKGIGTRLWMKRLEDIYGRFAFIFSKTMRDNIPARRLDVKFGFKKIYEDESFVYSVKPCIKELIPFVPLIRLSFRLGLGIVFWG